MSSKRRKPSSSSTPTKKKKVAKEANLESFFARSPQKLNAGSSTAIAEASSARVSDNGGIGDEDDEAIARRLAATEGIDVDVVRHLEQRWSQRGQVPSLSSSKLVEVIEIEEDEEAYAESVSRKATLVQPTSSPTGSKQAQNERPKRPVFGASTQGKLTADDFETYPDLSEDPVTFDPSDCPWSLSNAMPYSFLAHALSSVAETRSRIAIISILTNALRLIIHRHPASLLPALYLLSNVLSPPYVPLELGLGPSIISKAIQHVSGLTPSALKRLYNRTGDPGDVAYEAKSNVRTLVPHAKLTVSGVYDALMKICQAKGEGAGKRKQAIVERLLVAAKGEETRYLVRTLCLNIRVGAVRTSILTALSRALALTRPASATNVPPDSPYYVSPELLRKAGKAAVAASPSKSKKKVEIDSTRVAISERYTAAEGLLKRVYAQNPNYETIVSALLLFGLEGLSEHVSLTVGIPLLPTLGSPTRSLDEIYDRLGGGPFTAEFKYDGQRAQIHASRVGESAVTVKIFSRHLEDMTEKYPDVTCLFEAIFGLNSELSSAVFDSEIVAIDPVNGSLKTFQELSGRPRKDVRLEDIKVSVCVFAFDLLLLNGESLLGEPFRLRREQLRTTFPPFIPDVPGAARLAHVDCCESENGREAVEEFWQQSVDSRAEGLMIKLLDNAEVLEDASTSAVTGAMRTRKKPLPATYEPDKRTSAWLKLKKDYVTGLGDSLDLVPIGAWHGNGRKAQWWSPILLALWDERAGTFVALCKCMSGFSDEFYKALNERYAEGSSTCTRTNTWNCNTGGLTPEVYFEPREVWECKGADITISPVSVAAFGRVSDSRGLSLRFPRFIRPREDKGVYEASTPDFLLSLWRSQESKGSSANANDEGDLVDANVESSDAEEEDEGLL